MNLIVAIPVVAVICLAGGVDAQHPNRPAAKPSVVHPEKLERTPQRAPQKEERRQEKNGPGSAEHLAKLLKLSPDQRNKALSSLPPERRMQIEKRLSDYQKLPEPQRATALDRLRRMQSLPPQKQAQVRASLQKLTALPPPRHALVQKQINQMKALSDSDRSALVNSEEFRSKFTPAEQQMIEDIALVTPQN